MKDDTQFITDFHSSRESILKVADWLRSLGLNIRVPDPVLRPDSSERREFMDNGDIELIHPRGGRYRIEVKHRSLNFTCVEDFPFSTIYVDEIYKADRNPETLLAYVQVNRAETHAAVIQAVTRPAWVKEWDKFDEGQNRGCDSYLCPKEKAVFVCLTTS